MLKPTMSVRVGALTKHFQLDEDLADSVDSGATLSVSKKQSDTFRYCQCQTVILSHLSGCYEPSDTVAQWL